MTASRWRKSGEFDEFWCSPNHAKKKIFYARIYTVGQGYDHSETNQLINNLKKSPKSSQAELRYKNDGIQKFAEEAKLLFDGANVEIDLVPMPPSKLPGHPDYDDRLLKVAQKIENLCQNVKCLPLLNGTANRVAAHTVVETRNVKQIYDSIDVDHSLISQHRLEARIVVLDDVATSGASFEAVLRRIQEHFPTAKTVVVIWAKAKAPAPEEKEAQP